MKVDGLEQAQGKGLPAVQAILSSGFGKDEVSPPPGPSLKAHLSARVQVNTLATREATYKRPLEACWCTRQVAS